MTDSSAENRFALSETDLLKLASMMVLASFVTVITTVGHNGDY